MKTTETPWIIYPDKLNEGNILKNTPAGEYLRRFNFTYMHGELQSEYGYDIYFIANFGQPKKEHYIEEGVPDGIYRCTTYNGRICLLFLWRRRDTYAGLLVYENDTEAIEYANELYTKKSHIL